MNLSNVTLNSVTLHNPIYQVSFLEIIGKHFFTIREWVCCATHFALIVTIEVWGKVIFSQACASQSVHRGRGSLYDVTSCLAAWSHVPSGKGVFVPGPMFLLGVSVQEVLCLEGSLSGGSLSKGSLSGGLSPGVSVQWGLCPVGSLPGGLCPVTDPNPLTVKSGRYASYGNIILFKVFMYKFKMHCIYEELPLSKKAISTFYHQF